MKACALNRPKVRENVSAVVTIGCSRTSDWLKGWFVDQSQSVTSISEKDRGSVCEK